MGPMVRQPTVSYTSGKKKKLHVIVPVIIRATTHFSLANSSPIWTSSPSSTAHLFCTSAAAAAPAAAGNPRPCYAPRPARRSFAENGIRRSLSRRRPRRRAARRTADLAPPLAAATGVVYSGPAVLLLALCLPVWCETPFWCGCVESGEVIDREWEVGNFGTRVTRGVKSTKWSVFLCPCV